MNSLNFAEDSVITLVPSAAVGHAGSSGAVTMTWDLPTETMHVKEGDYIVRQGEAPKGLFFLKSGAVKILVNRPITRGRISSPEYISKLVGPGEFFGYKALIKGANSGFFAKALRASEVQVYPMDSIQKVMNGPNNLLKMVLTQMVKDMEAMESNNQLHYLASVQERIAYQLVILADKFGVPTQREGKPATSLSLKLTRNELAQLAGTINESLSRHLTEFREEGIIDLVGKEIIVKDRAALAAKSGNFR